MKYSIGFATILILVDTIVETVEDDIGANRVSDAWKEYYDNIGADRVNDAWEDYYKDPLDDANDRESSPISSLSSYISSSYTPSFDDASQNILPSDNIVSLYQIKTLTIYLPILLRNKNSTNSKFIFHQMLNFSL